MLTIARAGAESLLDLLRRMAAGHAPSEAGLDEALAANAFFFGFYAGWEGVGMDSLREALRYFRQPERVPAGTIPTCVAEGFRRAVAEIDLMEARLAWLREVDPSGIAGRMLAYLPADTPLDSTVHITIDAFNNAFAHAGGMGVSLLKGGGRPADVRGRHSARVAPPGRRLLGRARRRAPGAPRGKVGALRGRAPRGQPALGGTGQLLPIARLCLSSIERRSPCRRSCPCTTRPHRPRARSCSTPSMSSALDGSGARQAHSWSATFGP